jgi:hypothetical protein
MSHLDAGTWATIGVLLTWVFVILLVQGDRNPAADVLIVLSGVISAVCGGVALEAWLDARRHR